VAPLPRRLSAFTLIELMIVVAIVGILAAIAIPSFMRFQLKAKAGEAKTNLAAIRTAEESYQAEHGDYLAQATQVPASAPAPQKLAWPASAAGGFGEIGWAPEGPVYYRYAVQASAGGAQFTAEAIADIDGNGVRSEWAYVKPLPGAASGLAGAISSCTGSGVWNPATLGADLLETVGPCDALSGQSEF
jgi:type IV pilus assembly protein PilA